MIQVTDEQIAERDRWERKLMAGEVDLFGGLYMMLSSGAPATQYLLDRLNEAEAAYQDGEVKDLAEAFGILLMQNEKRRMKRLTEISDVVQMVDHFKDKGYKMYHPSDHKDDNGNYLESAFTKAREHLDKVTQDGEDVQPLLSVSRIFEIYYENKAASRPLGMKKKKVPNRPE